jgi:hypothetical protein
MVSDGGSYLEVEKPSMSDRSLLSRSSPKGARQFMLQADAMSSACLQGSEMGSILDFGHKQQIKDYGLGLWLIFIY